MKRILKKSFFGLFLLGILASGCVTHHYVDDTGRECERKYKFFILFLTSNYTCQPASEKN